MNDSLKITWIETYFRPLIFLSSEELEHFFTCGGTLLTGLNDASDTGQTHRHTIFWQRKREPVTHAFSPPNRRRTFSALIRGWPGRWIPVTRRPPWWSLGPSPCTLTRTPSFTRLPARLGVVTHRARSLFCLSLSLSFSPSHSLTHAHKHTHRFLSCCYIPSPRAPVTWLSIYERCTVPHT